jgi:hypothetical protein
MKPYRKASNWQPAGVEMFIAACRGRLAELRDEIAAEGARLAKRGVTGDGHTLWRDLDRLTTERDDLGRALADALKRPPEES